MNRWLWIIAACVPLCLGITCTITIPDDDDNGNDNYPYVRLNEATADIEIAGTAGGSAAIVTAAIESGGDTVHLQDGQEVAVNGSALTGPNFDGNYSRSITKAASYKIRVTEPQLGVIETTVASPDDFEITSPTAGDTVSLSGGFALQWSNPDPNAVYTVTLQQPLRGRTVILDAHADDGNGALAITAADLAEFRHGGTLTLVIEVAKTITTSDVEGLAEGSSATVELSDTVTVIPAE